MSYLYSQSLLSNFPNGLLHHQLAKELNNSGLSVTCLNINQSGDVISMWFSSTPSSNDLIIITDLISAHVPNPNMFDSLNFITVTSDYQVNKKSVYVDTSSSNITITLPKILRSSGAYIGIKKISANNTVIVAAYPGELVLGSSTVSLTTNGSYLFLFNNGSAWINADINSNVNPAENAQNISITNNKGDIAVDNGTDLLPLSVGSDGQVLTADSAEALGMKWTTISGNESLTEYVEPPTVPNTGLKTFSSLTTGFRIMAAIDPIGIITEYQTSLFSRDISLWKAQGNGNTVFLMNFGNSTTGTVTTRSVASNNLFTQTRRVGYVSSATVGSSAGTRHGAQQFWRGNQADLGGFLYICRFGLSSASSVATQRSFVGLIASTATMSNQDPSHSSNKNILGFGVDSGDSSWSFMHNDNSGSPVKEPLTGTFPPRDQSISLFESRIFSPPNGNEIYYSLRVLGGGSFYSGSISTVIPSQSTFLSPILWTNNDTTASAVGIDVAFQYIERF